MPIFWIKLFVPPSFWMIISVSSTVEVSFQSLAGRMGMPLASKGTHPCCWPDTPKETIFEGLICAAFNACNRAFSRASIQVWGSCSLAPGLSPSIIRWAWLPLPRTFPLKSTIRALVPWVPESTPIAYIILPLQWIGIYGGVRNRD